MGGAVRIEIPAEIENWALPFIDSMERKTHRKIPNSLFFI